MSCVAHALEKDEPQGEVKDTLDAGMTLVLKARETMLGGSRMVRAGEHSIGSCKFSGNSGYHTLWAFSE